MRSIRSTANRFPIWIADYVLVSYGTGAIMAVPAHDVRDFEFATTFQLPNRPGRRSTRKAEVDHETVHGRRTCFAGVRHGESTRGQFDGLSTEEFKAKIIAELEAAVGRAAVNYKLRDWLFSRQRFWGEPFPILHELDEAGNANRTDATGCRSQILPLICQTWKTSNRTVVPNRHWKKPTTSGCTRSLTEYATNAKPTRCRNGPVRAGITCGSSIRKNDEAFVDPELEKQWMPVDLYIGGAEHAVLHLLYCRFWHKVLFDRGHLHTPEPFKRLVNQGMILGDVEFTGYRD